MYCKVQYSSVQQTTIAIPERHVTICILKEILPKVTFRLATGGLGSQVLKKIKILDFEFFLHF